MSNTKVFAHRGASGYAPENTLEAFALAIRQGADGIELDVQLSSDGIPVVIHDETIDRVTDKTGYVKDYTLQELKELTVLKDRFPAYNQSKIPTLKEVLEAVKPSGIRTTARAARAARVPTATASAAVPAENSKATPHNSRLAA